VEDLTTSGTLADVVNCNHNSIILYFNFVNLNPYYVNVLATCAREENVTENVSRHSTPRMRRWNQYSTSTVQCYKCTLARENSGGAGAST
jgi:hypothetical protein